MHVITVIKASYHCVLVLVKPRHIDQHFVEFSLVLSEESPPG